MTIHYLRGAEKRYRFSMQGRQLRGRLQPPFFVRPAAETIPTFLPRFLPLTKIIETCFVRSAAIYGRSMPPILAAISMTWLYVLRWSKHELIHVTAWDHPCSDPKS